MNEMREIEFVHLWSVFVFVLHLNVETNLAIGRKCERYVLNHD